MTVISIITIQLKSKNKTMTVICLLFGLLLPSTLLMLPDLGVNPHFLLNSTQKTYYRMRQTGSFFSSISFWLATWLFSYSYLAQTYHPTDKFSKYLPIFGWIVAASIVLVFMIQMGVKKLITSASYTFSIIILINLLVLTTIGVALHRIRCLIKA